ncbi:MULTISPECIES: 23S rRNA (guanine(1835)-N(2))-methyltransferase RlmG [Serratia]|jgi:16S rRNA (guanine1207-N2)-methyltransferase|uniref:Ribosomal RNA large subunit methyltransferase G n=1 Tax=Serratia surfactantfaciens TaxID=2741499 RepID=A0ABS0M3D3_9GAMM|nr:MULTISPECIES: 23S rRNA (guanine(1835)-N(2))-methyltransferase RlmG [Serratia]WMW60926.1 23S rRNA (guanine(1835)-N(2))-methyltransferase RlmG [Serratia marcescens]AOF01026.1 23S rRNA (guanine(1835)-N(2))-methyltransferase [Serratia surfactantfaciens]MBH1921213.1 23S rRNA (guanine(1835)-N(2))-methyltransferase RlmG [Serratia surfactantfaciens]MBI6153962.1 23S rRNA (guanine(1835)-N(2))-methyltransferase RlmG [Serratia surfactantfaciens]MTD08108.1 23S rRNA (guanine(1835)-N(2))-methyltransferase
MSQLDLGTQQLELERYPQQEESTQLQAWEAADEYLLQQLENVDIGGRPVLIFNDNFGTLACALHAHRPYSVSDSYMSQLATRHNLKLNGLDPEQVTLLDSLAELPAAPAVVLIRVPKALALLEQQLRALRHVVTEDTLIVAGAKARDVHTSTMQLFEKVLGPTRTSLAWKKARLIFCQAADIVPPAAAETTDWTLDGTDWLIHNHANVFSRGSLDIGARLFMQHLPRGLNGHIVDLGCGNGVIGLTALAQNPEAQVTFVDESYMAVASSELNVEHNLPQELDRCQFEVNNALAGIERESVQAVLCNPPFHQQHAITDHTAWQMFCDAKRCLQVGGELRIVGNRHLDYHQKLKRLFGNCTLVASNKKFVILRAVKSGARR